MFAPGLANDLLDLSVVEGGIPRPRGTARVRSWCVSRGTPVSPRGR
jgi:hypothetical protein